MANDAQMPERIWATPEEAELLQPEEGFNPADQGMTEYLRKDLCAAWQVRALDVDDLAQIIRVVDGNNTLGAGELAEAILEAMPAPRIVGAMQNDAPEWIWACVEPDWEDGNGNPIVGGKFEGRDLTGNGVPYRRADLCASGQVRVQIANLSVWAGKAHPDQQLVDLSHVLAILDSTLSPPPACQQEAVPGDPHRYAVVSADYARPFLVGAYPTLANAIKAQCGSPEKWHIFEKYTHLPQPSESVGEAMECLLALVGTPIARRKLGLEPDDERLMIVRTALRALKGGE